MRRVATVVFSGLGIASWFVEELLLAPPIVAATAIIGPFLAFIVFALLYGAIHLAASGLVIRGIRNPTGSRFEHWVERTAREGGRGKVLLASGKLTGFAVAAFVLGGFLTTYIALRLRLFPNTKPLRVAVAASAIFSVSFAAIYTGLGELAVHVVRIIV